MSRPIRLSTAPVSTRRRVIVEGAPHELMFGLQRLNPVEKLRWFFDGNAGLRALMNRPQPTYSILPMSRPDRAKTLHAMSEPTTQIAENEKFAVIANRAALKLTPKTRSALAGDIK